MFHPWDPQRAQLARRTALHMNQGLRCGSSPTAAAAASAWRPRECPILFISVRHRRSGGDKTGRPVRPQRRNYTEPPDEKKSKPSETKAIIINI